MDIQLWYGDGFAGRTYSLQIGNWHVELSTGLGSEDEEREARRQAVAFLKMEGIDFDLTEVPFKWDGSL